MRQPMRFFCGGIVVLSCLLTQHVAAQSTAEATQTQLAKLAELTKSFQQAVANRDTELEFKLSPEIDKLANEVSESTDKTFQAALRKNDLAKARELIEQTERLLRTPAVYDFSSTKRLERYLESWIGMGNTHARLNQWQAAHDCFQHVEELAQQYLGHRSAFCSRTCTGRMTSLEKLGRAEEVAKLQPRAEYHRLTKAIDQALTYYVTDKQTGERRRGTAPSKQRYATAEPIARQQVEVAKKAFPDDPLVIADAHLEVVRLIVYQDRQDPATKEFMGPKLAAPSFAAAIKLLDSVDQHDLQQLRIAPEYGWLNWLVAEGMRRLRIGDPEDMAIFRRLEIVARSRRIELGISMPIECLESLRDGYGSFGTREEEEIFARRLINEVYAKRAAKQFDHKEDFRLAHNHARWLTYRGDFAEAAQAYSYAISIGTYLEAHQESRLFDLHMELVQAKLFEGKFIEAEQMVRVQQKWVQEKSREDQDEKKMMLEECDDKLNWILREQGRTKELEIKLLSQLAAAETSYQQNPKGNYGELSAALHNLEMLYNHGQSDMRHISILQRQLEIDRRQYGNRVIHHSLAVLASSLAAAGRRDEAVAHFEAAIASVPVTNKFTSEIERNNDLGMQILWHHQIVKIQLSIGDLPAAQRAAKSAELLLPAVMQYCPDPPASEAITVAEMFYAIDDYETAVRHLTNYINFAIKPETKMKSRLRGRAILLLAEINCKQGKKVDARDLIMNSAFPKVADTSAIIFDMRAVELLAQQEFHAEARTLLEKLPPQDKFANRAVGPRLENELQDARLRWQLGQRSEAVRIVQRAIDLADDLRAAASTFEADQANVFGTYRGLFEQLVAWEIELGNASAAWAAAERSSAQSLYSQLAREIRPTAGLTAEQEQEFRNRLAAAHVKVSSLQYQINALSSGAPSTSESSRQRKASLERAREAAQFALMNVYRDARKLSRSDLLRSSEHRKPVELTDLQPWLESQNGLLLMYHFGERDGFCFVLRRHGLPAVIKLELSTDQAKEFGVEAGPLTNRRLTAALTQKVSVDGKEQDRFSYELLADRLNGDLALPRMQQLWNLLIPASVKAELSDGSLQNLVIVPDGHLARLPFEALVVKTTDQGPVYLLDCGPAICYGPSSSVLYELAKRKPVDEKALAAVLTVGGIDYASINKPASLQPTSLSDSLSVRGRFAGAGGRLAPLPHTDTESKWVADQFSPLTSVLKLNGRDATEAKVRSAVLDKTLIHLACHGVADENFGNFFGSLAFYPGSEVDPHNDGFLAMPEIYELDLRRCELALLSACQTNFGPSQVGEGAWTLSRGFLVAGSRRAIATNWSVDDLASATLVKHLTEKIAVNYRDKKPQNYAAALHDAKRQIRNTGAWSSPFYWAPFVLVGPN